MRFCLEYTWHMYVTYTLRKVHLIWQGMGMKILKLEAWNFSNPLASGWIFRSPPSPPPIGFEVYKFSEPLSKPNNFSEPPFRVSKNFWKPPSISSSPLLVILNELSLTRLIKYSCTHLDINADNLNEDWKQAAKSRKISTQSYLRTLLARQMDLCMSQ